MRSIGFSTGALALDDFRCALAMLRSKPEIDAVELSALRERELVPLIEALPSLDLQPFKHVSFHAPSAMTADFEAVATKRLQEIADRRWLIVVHPDVITKPDLWKRFGEQLCVENMDKRKPIGQTAEHLERVFDRLPSASFCFDLGHARQVDPTMTEAFLILSRFRTRLKQLHVSEVNSDSRHGELTLEACLAFSRLASLIPDDVPAIIESRVPRPDIDREVRMVRKLFDVGTKGEPSTVTAHPEAANATIARF